MSVLGYEIQYWVRCRNSCIDVCSADACKCRGRCRESEIFYVFTLFQPENLVAGKSSALMGVTILLIGGIALFAAGIFLFCKKDLYI